MLFAVWAPERRSRDKGVCFFGQLNCCMRFHVVHTSMSERYVNTYAPPQTDCSPNLGLSIPPEAYDFNFIFPVCKLKSNRVELRPFVVSHKKRLSQMLIEINTAAFFACQAVVGRDSANFDWSAECTQWFQLIWEDAHVARGSQQTRSCRLMLSCAIFRKLIICKAHLIYAIYSGPVGAVYGPTDPADYKFAGTTGLLNCSKENKCAEIGYLIVLPEFQVIYLPHSRHWNPWSQMICCCTLADCPNREPMSILIKLAFCCIMHWMFHLRAVWDWGGVLGWQKQRIPNLKTPHLG